MGCASSSIVKPTMPFPQSIPSNPSVRSRLSLPNSCLVNIGIEIEGEKIEGSLVNASKSVFKSTLYLHHRTSSLAERQSQYVMPAGPQRVHQLPSIHIPGAASISGGEDSEIERQRMTNFSGLSQVATAKARSSSIPLLKCEVIEMRSEEVLGGRVATGKHPFGRASMSSKEHLMAFQKCNNLKSLEPKSKTSIVTSKCIDFMSPNSEFKTPTKPLIEASPNQKEFESPIELIERAKSTQIIDHNHVQRLRSKVFSNSANNSVPRISVTRVESSISEYRILEPITPVVSGLNSPFIHRKMMSGAELSCNERRASTPSNFSSTHAQTPSNLNPELSKPIDSITPITANSAKSKQIRDIQGRILKLPGSRVRSQLGQILGYSDSSNATQFIGNEELPLRETQEPKILAETRHEKKSFSVFSSENSIAKFDGGMKNIDILSKQQDSKLSIFSNKTKSMKGDFCLRTSQSGTQTQRGKDLSLFKRALLNRGSKLKLELPEKESLSPISDRNNEQSSPESKISNPSDKVNKISILAIEQQSSELKINSLHGDNQTTRFISEGKRNQIKSRVSQGRKSVSSLSNNSLCHLSDTSSFPEEHDCRLELSTDRVEKTIEVTIFQANSSVSSANLKSSSSSVIEDEQTPEVIIKASISQTSFSESQ
jgi:hypothetical protein